MSALSASLDPSDARSSALAARGAGDRATALRLFREAGDPWSRCDAVLERLALGQTAQASAEIAALLTEKPDFAPAHRAAGLVARHREEREAALTHFQTAAMLAPADLWSRQDAAGELRALGRPAEAEETLRAMATATPLPHALRDLGRAARARGDDEAALAAIRVAADLMPADPWFALDLAETLLALGREDEAERTAARLAERHELFAGAPRFLARLARRRCQPEREIDSLRRAAALDPAGGALDLADALLRAGQREEAETLAARHLVRRAGDVRALRLLSRAARATGDLTLALSHLRAAARAAPNDAAVQAERAALALDLGHGHEAEAAARAALSLDDAATGARRTLAACLRARGLRHDARRVAEEGWLNGAAPGQAGLDLAADLRADGEFDRAETIYRELLRSEVAADAGVELALLLRRRSGAAAARDQLDETLRLDPVHPRALLCLGDLARERADWGEADRCYDRALAARPGFAWALAGLAQTAEMRGLPDRAMALWREAAQADPAEGWFAIALAARYGERGEIAAARERLLTVLETSRRAPEAALARARLLRAAGDGTSAIDAFETAARRWPHVVEAWIEASETGLRCGQPARAMRLLDEGETANPTHPAFAEARARHALSRDDLAGAEAHLIRAETLDPGRLWPQIARARLAAQRGCSPDAGERFVAIRARFGWNAELELAAADIERQSGRLERARARLRRALRRAPGHGLLAFQAALTALDAGRPDAAEEILPQLPAATLAEQGRRHFVAAQVASARWNFDAAIREGEAAVRLLPEDGWVRNRLAHATLLALDTDRTGAVLADLARLEAGTNALRGRSANPSQSHYGQLLDEFRLDGEAIEALRPALARPATERLEAIAAVVRRFPDSTAPAILFLIERARVGSPNPRAAEGPAIPRTIHQFWTDAVPPPDVALYLQTWRDRHPSFRHQLWSDASAREFLRGHAEPEVLQAFERAREPAMRADLFRLALLGRVGGIWADADDRCRRPVEALLTEGAGLVAYQEDLGSLGNNWLAARPGHPILKEALTQAVTAVNRGDGDILWLSTGPGLLTRVAAQALAADGADLTILDRTTFLRFVSIHCLAAYKTSDRHWSRTAFGGRPRAQAARSGGANGRSVAE